MIVLCLLFFLSGAAGLMYQIIWTRMFLLLFGSTVYTVVAVVSAFMAGLALGSWLVTKVPKKYISLSLYAGLEIFVGATTAATPFLFSFASGVFATSGHALVVKFLVAFILLLPSAAAMGATLPILVETVVEKFGKSISTTVSLLYGINTAGAIAGTLLSAYVLIELLGLRLTLWTTSAMSLAIGLIAFTLNKRLQMTRIPERKEVLKNSFFQLSQRETQLMLVIFGVSGLVSLSYEILWTRMLTPMSGTFIYAFAFILALYLIGITTGSFLAHLVSDRIRPPILFATAEAVIGLGAFGSLVVASDYVHVPIWLTQIGVLLPATIGMGLTFPIISRLAKDATGFIGRSYALNTFGSLLGPLVAAFVLLPLFGTQRSIVLLAALNVALAALLLRRARVVLFLVAALFVLASGDKKLMTERTIQGYVNRFASGGYQWSYLEDETAAVLGYKKNDTSDYGLLVDGIGMSVLVDETKLMAHLPLLVHPDPKRLLVVAFGMGTTFRSGLTHDIAVDAVELVPSVPNMFPIFFTDGKSVLANPNGHIIIDDGRNYVRTTKIRYDVVTIDPPPPVNSAGTTVLYAKEFYQQTKKILNPGGIVSQWFFYGTSEDDFRMLLKSFVDEFPYILAFRSPRSLGLYLLGSELPIAINKPAIRARLAANPKILKDLNEWGVWHADNLTSLYAVDRQKLLTITQDVPPVTDDHPRTEYFLLRHTFFPAQLARDEVILK
ncbi:fused MFS/spermidine synthase [Candidatus Gottesmanbacteria bacterium]|nr:fused MFS/spermidine synthase [Candidatus Gottesmanbacteria bacterium]